MIIKQKYIDVSALIKKVFEKSNQIESSILESYIFLRLNIKKYIF